MKVEVKEGVSLNWEFPCLGVADDGEIVLFSEENVGTVISGAGNEVGSHYTGWIMSCFTPFTGSVTLSN